MLAILNSAGTPVVHYSYDAWGNHLSISGSMASTLGVHNPLRYRGYVYDQETGLYYLQSRYYNPEWGRFISADTTDILTATPMGLTDKNLFAYCDNNPVTRIDISGDFWNTIIGAAAGALVGGITAAIMETNIGAGIAGGALSGAISGAAVDITIATGGAGLVAFASVATASGFGGAAGSYVNQRMNGVRHKDIDWDAVVIDGVWGAAGGMLSYGMADVGGSTCKTLLENLSLKRKELIVQAATDFGTATIISAGTWLNSAKMNMLYKRIG